MKKITLAAGAAGAALALTVLAGTALAQQAPGRADTDGDGRLSQSEFVAGRVSRLSAIDANRDGAISAEERRSGLDTRRNQRASQRFERLDTDGNGSVSRDEFMAPRQMRADRQGGRPDGRQRMAGRQPVSIAQAEARLTEAFGRLDTDRDGYLTTEERRAGRTAVREARRERRAGRMGQRPGQPSPSRTPPE